jgi:hypothetical protein
MIEFIIIWPCVCISWRKLEKEGMMLSWVFTVWLQLTSNQCCGSVTCWYGSGSGFADPYIWLTDPDPAIFASDLSDTEKKCVLSFLASYFLMYCAFISKTKSRIKSHKTRESRFFLLFLLDKDPDPYPWLTDPDPVDPITYGSYGFGSATLLVTTEQTCFTVML